MKLPLSDTDAADIQEGVLRQQEARQRLLNATGRKERRDHAQAYLDATHWLQSIFDRVTSTAEYVAVTTIKPIDEETPR